MPYEIKPLKWKRHRMHDGEIMMKGFAPLFGDGERHDYQAWRYRGDSGGWISHWWKTGEVIRIAATQAEVIEACEQHHRSRMLAGLREV